MKDANQRDLTGYGRHRPAATIRDLCGAPPLGWYTGRYSDNTRRLVMEETETLHDSDACNDDLP
jgi:hypothetical protein